MSQQEGENSSLIQPTKSEPTDPLVKAPEGDAGGFRKLRWFVLVLACTGMLGNYYCYDLPTACKKQLCKQLDLDDFQYNLFYSVYSFPNIVLPLFAGLLVDRLGATTCLLLFNAFVFTGQGLFALGVSTNSFYLALVGRAIFGIGGESISVAQSANLAFWFKGKEMAMAMGLDLSISKMGSVINDWVSPAIFEAYTLNYALWFGFLVCCIAIAATVVLVCLNRWAERKRRAAGENIDKAPEDIPNLRDIRHFNSRLWLICWSCVIVYATILPFNNISSDFLQDRYEYSTSQGDRIMAIPFFVNACASPFLGGFVDRLGYRATLLCISATSITLVHVLFAFTMITPYVPLILMGISYAIYAACLWPSVPLVVQERMVGTAYGFITMVQNFGLCFVPMIVGSLKKHTGGYEIVELFFACVGAIGVLLSIWLFLEDKLLGGVINKPSLQDTGAAPASADASKKKEEEKSLLSSSDAVKEVVVTSSPHLVDNNSTSKPINS